MTADELVEFRLRRTTLEQARCQFLMIEESYQHWCEAIGKKYELAGKFSVDSASGALMPQAEVPNGRPNTAPQSH